MNQEVKDANVQLLTKRSLAHHLSVSVQEINRRMRLGNLKAYKTQKGVAFFHPDQVEEQRSYARGKNKVVTSEVKTVVEYTGEEAAVVFRELQAGSSLTNIVVEKMIHPAVVRAASEAFSQLQGCLFLGEDTLRAIEKLPLDGEFPIQTGSQLVEILKEAFREKACIKCQKKTRKVCLGCAQGLARKGRGAASDSPEESDERESSTENDVTPTHEEHA